MRLWNNSNLYAALSLILSHWINISDHFITWWLKHSPGDIGSCSLKQIKIINFNFQYSGWVLWPLSYSIKGISTISHGHQQLLWKRTELNNWTEFITVNHKWRELINTLWMRGVQTNPYRWHFLARSLVRLPLSTCEPIAPNHGHLILYMNYLIHFRGRNKVSTNLDKTSPFVDLPHSN